MNASYIRALADIAGRPGVTRRDTLTIVRRLTRHVCEYRDEIRQTRRAYDIVDICPRAEQTG